MGYGRQVENGYVKHRGVVQRRMHTLNMREETWLHMQLAERSCQDPGAQHAFAGDVGLE